MFICNEVRGSLNIYDGPLLKMAIIHKQGGRAYLFITAHHLIMDGISWRILLEDLFRVYSSLSEGSHSVLLLENGAVQKTGTPR